MEIHDILSKVKNDGRKLLYYHEAKEILVACGIPTAPFRVASNREEAVEAALSIGFPVVMKILSPDLVHKSDAGAVAVDLRTEAEVARAFYSMMDHVRGRNSTLRVEGVILEKMLSGIEMIVGTTHDVQFGPVLMLGTGGIWTELLKDTSFRLIPIEPIDAEEMIEDLQARPLLQGYRGQRVDLEGLKNLLLKTSDLIHRFGEITSMDLNPVFASSEGCTVADVRMMIREGT